MVEVERNKSVHRNLALLIVLSLLVIVRSTINNFKSEIEWRYYAAVFFLFVIAFLLLILINALSEIFKSKPALIISQEGIEDNVSFSESGFIEWENIQSVSLGKLKGNDHLILKLRKDYKVKVRSFPSKRILLEEIRRKFGNAIAINKDYVVGDLAHIMEQITKMKAEHKTTRNPEDRGIANPNIFSNN